MIFELQMMRFDSIMGDEGERSPIVMKRVFVVILLAAALFIFTGCSSGKMNEVNFH